MNARRFGHIAAAGVLVLAGLAHAAPTPPAEPGPGVRDPRLPVTQIDADSFTIQYFTPTPAETRVQVRVGGRSAAELRGLAGRTDDPWADPGVREIQGPPGRRTFHRLRIDGLPPGERVFYRVWAPGENPDAAERAWGATEDWRRERAVSTLAPQGERTLIRLPVKVLVMPNVVELPDDAGAAPPEPLGARELGVIARELNDAAVYLFVNTGFRVWVDFEYAVDDRWQRWGDEPTGDAARALDPGLRGLPACRNHAGVPYRKPGGGIQSFVDMRDPRRVPDAPVIEDDPYVGQVEIALVRRWNGSAWELVESGGGTLGADDIHLGYPGRTQFLGGGDLAWLAAHEMHHQLEAIGRLSLSMREDDRIVYNHHQPRRRTPLSGAPGTLRDAEKDGHWSTAGPHGTHWDGMAYWLRTLTDAQLLRLAVGQTVTVADADADGVPDADPRLPIDEARFGSSPALASTDGRLSDFEKIRLSTWAPGPLQSTWIKPRGAALRPLATHPDSDGDGIDDADDALPLVPAEPFVWPVAAAADGDPSEWEGLPEAGRIAADGASIVLRQAHDASGLTQLWEITGPVVGVHATLEADGQGFFGEGARSYALLCGDPVRMLDEQPGMTWASSRRPDGALVVEVRFENGGEGAWFWRGGGRDVSVSVLARLEGGREYAMWEPYRPTAFTMLGGHDEAIDRTIRVAERTDAAPSPRPAAHSAARPSPSARRGVVRPGRVHR